MVGSDVVDVGVCNIACTCFSLSIYKYKCTYICICIKRIEGGKTKNERKDTMCVVMLANSHVQTQGCFLLEPNLNRLNS